MDVVGVRLEMPSNQPVVLLREQDGTRYLPIWIGTVEATAIAFALEGVTPPRPLTHDLIRDILEAVSEPLAQVLITNLTEGTFFATLRFASGTEVSARPSDAIAIALRTGTPVLADVDLLAEAGVEIDDEQVTADPTAADATTDPSVDPAASEAEVALFREFLDTVTPEDFEES